ncbi:hypothetical protein FKW77_010581 [Venturia effusa]|uniref:J domain-containing protein n=1 Tax=Venturia effusa TaxID=50376 RepID=A0A517KXW3_9PEZI|nr:hypothetical protein FKW77_010581 [Venturia effusa]
MSPTTPRVASQSPIVIADSDTSSSFAPAVDRSRPQPHRLSSSQTPSTPARQHFGNQPATLLDMAVDEDHRTSSSPERSTIAFCACGSEFGQFYNSWSKVTGSYYLPWTVGSYSCSGLHRKLKPKPASNDSALANCERDFFKLPKIELKSDVTGQLVEAIIESGQPDASYHQEQPASSDRATMETSLENPVALARKYSAAQMANPLLPPQLRPGTSEETRRFDPMISRPLIPHASHQAQKSMFHDRDPPPQNRHNERAGPFASPVNGHMHINGHPGSPRNGYPSNIAVKLEAIDRLQTQVNLNRATLESCTRDIARVDSNIIRLQASFSEHFEGLRREIIQSRINPQPQPVQQGDRMDDEAFAVFSDALSSVQTKANEVDSLRLQMVDIKRRIKRLEEVQANAPAAPPTSNDRAPFPSGARESSVHHTPVVQTAVISDAPRTTTPSRQEARPYGNLRGRLPSQTPDVVHSSYAGHVEPTSGGWVSVNHGAKRGFSNGMDRRSDAEETPIGSPKRQKLTPLEPRHQYEAAHEPGPLRFDRMDTDESIQSQSQSQRHPAEIQNPYPDSTNPSTFVPYTDQLSPEDTWRSESQRAATAGSALVKSRAYSSPRGRPRGSGRGRGGRPRKSLPNDREMMTRQVTPEWEKETWTGAQVRADGFYYPGGDRGALLRRGSLGGQGQPSQATSPPGSMGDPYGHAKKTRTKPIRNSDGVLIRKDGRPDMRSQSSAANLRKVHARKEEEKRMESNSRTSPMSAFGTRVTSPNSQNSGEQERTHYALSRMFPHGVEEHRGVLTSSEHYFASASHSPTESKLPAMRAQSEGSAETGGSTLEPSHFREQPSQQGDLEREQVEHQVESTVEAGRDEAVADNSSPVEPQREQSTGSLPREHGSTEPPVVPAAAAGADAVQSTDDVAAVHTPVSNVLEPSSTTQPADVTIPSTDNIQLSTPQTHYDFFPNTFPSGPPPKGHFSVDTRALRNEFLKLQAQAHPDLHPAERKKQAEALSSRINEAYKTLQSPLLRAQYLLSLRGETAHEDDAAKLGDASEDQDLLMEVLELREAIEEAQVQEEVDAIKRENEERVRESVRVLEEAFKADDIDTARREAVKLRYWINVEETLHAWEEGKPAPLLQH